MSDDKDYLLIHNECFDCGKTFTSFLEMHVCHDCARLRRIERAKRRRPAGDPSTSAQGGE